MADKSGSQICRDAREAKKTALRAGYAAKGYQVAREIPEVLERVMCYCGCDRNPGHQNNLDCFADDHGAG